MCNDDSLAVSILHHTRLLFLFLFFFNDTATTEIYTLSLHDALPISRHSGPFPKPPTWPWPGSPREPGRGRPCGPDSHCAGSRSEEHTSELQSQSNLVCRLLLEKKKTTSYPTTTDASSQSRTDSSPHH